MINELEDVFNKVNKLAEYSQNLRNENLRLRSTLSELSEENQNLSFRMKEAHDRVNSLLNDLSLLKSEGGT